MNFNKLIMKICKTAIRDILHAYVYSDIIRCGNITTGVYITSILNIYNHEEIEWNKCGIIHIVILFVYTPTPIDSKIALTLTFNERKNHPSFSINYFEIISIGFFLIILIVGISTPIRTDAIVIPIIIST